MGSSIAASLTAWLGYDGNSARTMTMKSKQAVCTLASLLASSAFLIPLAAHAQRSDLGVDRPQGRSPGSSTRLGIGWEATALVLDMPNSSQFELLIPISGNVPVCGVSGLQGGGLAIFWRNDRVVEYGCWLALESDADTWVQFEMNSGIAMRLPMRAFNKRPVRE